MDKSGKEINFSILHKENLCYNEINRSTGCSATTLNFCFRSRIDFEPISIKAQLSSTRIDLKTLLDFDETDDDIQEIINKELKNISSLQLKT